mmetsp:Transcript_19109/g.55080  ORF Transcript_19109/g.55080 Transcript_19109/m.55080 type:complete len:95 (+) Transcript_19109:335-619(+)
MTKDIPAAAWFFLVALPLFVLARDRVDPVSVPAREGHLLSDRTYMYFRRDNNVLAGECTSTEWAAVAVHFSKFEVAWAEAAVFEACVGEGGVVG